MTKLKSKKMTKSTLALIIMAVAMVAMLAFGGTYAYFTATAGAAINSSVTTGHVELSTAEGATITKSFTADYAVPGDTLWDVSIGLVNKSNVKTYVFATWTLTNEAGVTLNVTGSTWTQLKNGEEDVTGVFYKELAASTTTNTTVSETFTSSVVFAESNGNTTMDKTVSCSVSFVQAQFDHMDTPYAAYQAAIA